MFASPSSHTPPPAHTTKSKYPARPRPSNTGNRVSEWRPVSNLYFVPPFTAPLYSLSLRDIRRLMYLSPVSLRDPISKLPFRTHCAKTFKPHIIQPALFHLQHILVLLTASLCLYWAPWPRPIPSPQYLQILTTIPRNNNMNSSTRLPQARHCASLLSTTLSTRPVTMPRRAAINSLAGGLLKCLQVSSHY